MENLPGPVMNSNAKIARYMSDSSFTLRGSPACITKSAMHMVNIIGIRHRRNNAPSTKPIEQRISANNTNHSDRVLPIPIGSGNVNGASPYVCILAIPCERNMKPNIMRAMSITKEFADDDTGS